VGGGGLAAASVAAAALLVAHPAARSRAGAARAAAELYEDMSVMQHQESLEDLDVVEVLHTLEAEP